MLIKERGVVIVGEVVRLWLYILESCAMSLLSSILICNGSCCVDIRSVPETSEDPGYFQLEAYY